MGNLFAKFCVLASMLVYSGFSHSDVCKEIALSVSQFAFHKKEYKDWMKVSHDAFDPVPFAVLTVDANRLRLSELGLSKRKIKSMLRTIVTTKLNVPEEQEMNIAYYYYYLDCKLSDKKIKMLSFKKAAPKISTCLEASNQEGVDPLRCLADSIVIL